MTAYENSLSDLLVKLRCEKLKKQADLRKKHLDIIALKKKQQKIDLANQFFQGLFGKPRFYFQKQMLFHKSLQNKCEQVFRTNKAVNLCNT